MVLKGGDLPLELCLPWLAEADLLVAADGAGAELIRLGLRPLVVGDLDSFREDWPHVQSRPDQDFSDADKALAEAATRGAERIVLTGVEGDRLDHVLASMGSALRAPVPVDLVLRRARGFFVTSDRPGRWEWAAGRRFSAIPVPTAQGVTLSGAEWPLAGADLAWGGDISLSNQAVEALEASVKSGALLVLIECGPTEADAPIWRT